MNNAHIHKMRSKTLRKAVRRQPQQRRARQTVDAVLEAVVRIVKREGMKAVTTNRVAEVAGVSIGSVYQYFPDKRAMFVALHRRHIEEIDQLVNRTIVEHAHSSLAGLIRAVFDALIEAHASDPEYSGVIFSEIPHRPEGTNDFAVRLRGVFRLALGSKSSELKRPRDLDKATFVVANMIDALAHGAVLRRPPGLSLDEAKKEAVRAVLAYLTGSS
jgi:AcrR family transcriptional regulator